MEWGTILGGGGFVIALIGGVVAWRKSGPERTSILVDAATDVVLIQKGELERLHTVLAQIRQELADANARAWKAEARAEELLRRVKHLEVTQREAQERRFTDIEDRVTAEEARNTDIERQADKDRRGHEGA